MNSLTLNDMNIDLTRELAEVMKLSVNDSSEYLLGKKFIDSLSNSILSNQIDQIRSLLISFMKNREENSIRKNKLDDVLVKIMRKLDKISTTKTLISFLKKEGKWGNVIANELLCYERKNIHYINLYTSPYKYADDGIYPIVELWIKKAVKECDFPFVFENGYDFFYDFVLMANNYDLAVIEKASQVR